MNLIVTILCTISLVAGFLNCQRGSNQSVGGESIEVHPATILPDSDAGWKVTVLPDEAKIKFENVHFINSDIGFANDFSNGISKIYRTDDGARSWQQLGDLRDFLISEMRFVNEKEGLLVANKLSPSSNTMENGAFVFRTTDGGRQWRTVYGQANALFSATKSDGNISVVVGRYDIATPNMIPKTEARMIVIVSNDNGQTWKDISAELNNIAQSSNGRVGDFLRDVILLKDQRMLVLSANRKIYEGSDFGSSWVLDSDLSKEPKSAGIRELGLLNDGRTWVVGGNLNSHGKLSFVALRDRIGHWTAHSLSNYFFSDAEFLSANEVVAVGSIVHKDNFGGNDDLDKGVILYSANGGSDWNVIYQSSDSTNFRKITRLSHSKLLVTGKDGDLVSVERKSLN